MAGAAAAASTILAAMVNQAHMQKLEKGISST
jgi:hypothetical protein